MPLSICKGNKRNKLIKKQQQKTSATKKTDFHLDSACRGGYLLKIEPSVAYKSVAYKQKCLIGLYVYTQEY